jgi:hypothetical protein
MIQENIDTVYPIVSVLNDYKQQVIQFVEQLTF